MQCTYHGLACGPDGRCVFCRRSERVLGASHRHGRDPARKLAILVVALMAAIATFFLVGALLDTR